MMWHGEPISALVDRFKSGLGHLTPFVSIDGYPEYQTGQHGLDSTQSHALSAAVQEVIGSQYTFDPICFVLIVGHADTALRKAVHERTRFEDEISSKRAQAAWDYFYRRLISESEQAHYAKVLKHAEVGVGSRHKKHLSARTEQEMRRNRRVEIYFARRHLILRGCRACADPGGHDVQSLFDRSHEHAGKGAAAN